MRTDIDGLTSAASRTNSEFLVSFQVPLKVLMFLGLRSWFSEFWEQSKTTVMKFSIEPGSKREKLAGLTISVCISYPNFHMSLEVGSNSVNYKLAGNFVSYITTIS